MEETVVIQNPTSGNEDHTDTVQAKAKSLGYSLKQTEGPGDAVTLAKEAAETGSSTIVAGGGDGTVNEVVRGIDQAEAFRGVTLGVLPLGTGNNFAKQLGITDIDTAFSVVEGGERRRIDIGRANSHVFVNSCVAGLTAKSSSETSSDQKARLGTLAYVITTLQTIPDFEALRLTVKTKSGEREETTWDGDALIVLVGNGRRFTIGNDTQANMEDGLLDVAVIKDVSTFDLMSEAFHERLFDHASTDVIRSQTPSLTISIHNPDAVTFSLDGEIIQQREGHVGVENVASIPKATNTPSRTTLMTVTTIPAFPVSSAPR